MGEVTLSGGELLALLLGAALFSSALTLTVLWAAFRFHYGPELERRLDERMRTGVQLIQEGIRERLRERARDLARTGIGILGVRRNARDCDDDHGA